MSSKTPLAFSLSPSSFSSPPLHVITVGHVDHGKSTLLGRLLYDTDSLSDQQKQALQAAAARQLKLPVKVESIDFDDDVFFTSTANFNSCEAGIEWAFLLDAFLEEQKQNITIDTTQLVFRTPLRSYVMIDAPGHEEFLKNMIAGATRADAALLLIDVVDGIQAQTQKHLELLNLMRINQVVVVLNKMDLIDREESFFATRVQEIRTLFQQEGLLLQEIIPIVARTGENLVARSQKMSWYQGSTVLEALEKMKSIPALEAGPLRLMVQDVYRFDEKRLIVGRIESGRLQVGEEIVFWPGRKTTRVRSLEKWGSPEQPQSAVARESVAITLEEPLFVERGDIGCDKDHPPLERREMNAQIFWLDAEPLSLNQSVTIQLGTQRELARVVDVIDSKTNSIMQHEIARVKIHLSRPLIYDCYEKIGAMGRFVIIAHERMAGGGVIQSGCHVAASPRKRVSSEQPVNYRRKQFGHRGAVFWLTGLSGAGKSTIARGLETLLQERGFATTILDGDNLRQGLCADLGFSLEDRSENIRRTGEVAKLFSEAGLIVICALISPLHADRERVKVSCLRNGIIFKEIFVDAPLEICEERDPRGLYQKARRGDIEHFTGITSPYEIPMAADAHLLTTGSSSEETINQLYEMVVDWMEQEGSFQT